MDEEIERLVVSVRADTGAFGRDVAEMRRTLESGLGEGVESAGRRIEGALAGAIRTGRFGFEDLRRTALAVLGDIAAAAIDAGLGSLGGAKGGGLAGIASGLLGALLGAPGRATGGPVVGGRAYRVGERGPEWFVPAASGRIDAAAGSGGGAREVRVTVNINAPAGEGARALARSGRQVARAVRGALERA